jgi:hypothetical protein
MATDLRTDPQDGVDIMVDLETMGTSANSIILSIGAVLFQPTTGKPGQTFYERIDIDSYQPYLPWFSFSGKTITWWMQQNEEARKEAFGGERKNIREVMEMFLHWCIKVAVGKRIRLWSHGASFDIPIITWTLQYFGMTEPWKFWDIRDTRTMFDLGKIQFSSVVSKETKYPIHHALGDCFRQIEGVRLAKQNLG